MPEPLCRPCKELQQDVVAHRIVGKTPMCDAHFRSAMGMPPLGAGSGPVKKKAEGKQMAKRIDEATKAAILKDSAAGMNVNAIATKHGVGWITAKTIVSGDGPKRAGGAKKAGHQSPSRNVRTPAAQRRRVRWNSAMRCGLRCLSNIRRRRC
jgi:hypothetical protein